MKRLFMLVELSLDIRKRYEFVELRERFEIRKK